jgi:hypothetical protein
MSLERALLPCAVIALLSSACAAKKTSEPAQLSFDIGFPSTSAAVLTDNVKVYVFAGQMSCNDLVRLRQTAQPFPAALVETPALAPCQLLENRGNSFDLNANADYTMVAVGQIGGHDVFIGCAVQVGYGATQALSIPLTFIDDRQKLGTTNCNTLSDKCKGACQ